MATTEELKLRVVHKHDTEENWLKATNFIPKQGEIIIYDIDANYNYERFKIGDGTSNVNALPFASSQEIKEIDDSAFYIKNIPTNLLPYAEIGKVGGMTHKDGDAVKSAKVTEVKSVGANLIPFPYYENPKTLNGVTITVLADGGINIKGTPEVNTGFYLTSAGTRLPIRAGVYTASITKCDGVYIVIGITGVREYNAYTENGTTFTVTEDNTMYARVRLTQGVAIDATVYPMLNVGASAVPYKPYVGDIDTFAIPTEVQDLDGYGEGINDTCYNYIDYENRQFVKRVGVVDMGTLDWSYDDPVAKFEAVLDNCRESGNVLCTGYETTFSMGEVYGCAPGMICAGSGYIALCDNTYWSAESFKSAVSGKPLYYELATPEIIDISDFIMEDNFIEVEGGGTVVAVNEHSLGAPITINYYKDTGKEAIGAKTIVGNLIGNASRDFRGQQIDTTYIKDISLSGQNLTFTRGDGTTVTLDLSSLISTSTQNYLDTTVAEEATW